MGIEPKFHIVEKDGPVVIWRFKNPPQNLIDMDTITELTELIEEFEADPDLRAAVFTSAVPDVFMKHFDVSKILELWSSQTPEEAEKAREEYLKNPPPPRGFSRLRTKPIIAAINGHAQGGGCETALQCEFLFISPLATLGQPEVNAGILAGGGGTQRITRLVGKAKAMEILLLGKPIFANEALELGIVNRICDPMTIVEEAIAFGKELALRPPLAIAHNMRCIYEGGDMHLREGLMLEQQLFQELTRSDDAKAIMAAYTATGQTGIETEE